MQEEYGELKGKVVAYMNRTSYKYCEKNGWIVDGLYRSVSGNWLTVVLDNEKDWVAYISSKKREEA